MALHDYCFLLCERKCKDLIFAFHGVQKKGFLPRCSVGPDTLVDLST